MKIGIVTVTFNSSSVLEDFFTSIEQQDYSEFNLYLIDNNSIDDTLLKAESWNFKSKEVTFLERRYTAKWNQGGGGEAEARRGEG